MPAEGRLVLVVDDDPAHAAWHRARARRVSACSSAHDGPKACGSAERHRPAAILLDVLMPEMDGWEVLRRLKAKPELRRIPVILLTIVDDAEVGLALGAADYLREAGRRGPWLADRCAGIRRRGAAAVLVVDDEFEGRDLLQRLLERQGIAVGRGRRRGRGAGVARAARPALADLLDLVMPGEDGFRVVERLGQGRALARDPGHRRHRQGPDQREATCSPGTSAGSSARAGSSAPCCDRGARAAGRSRAAAP